MKDPVKATKEAYYSLLNGNIECNGSPVSVHIAEGDKAENNYYIILNAFASEQAANKHAYIHTVTASIEVCAKLLNKLSDPFDSVDVIIQKVLDLLIISNNQYGLDYGGDFQVSSIRMQSSNHIPVQPNEGNRLFQRTTVFSQIINQL